MIFFRQGLRINRPGNGNRTLTVYITPDNRRFYAAGSIRLYPALLCEQETAKRLAKVLYHIISLIFAVYQHVESDLLLPCNTLRNFCTIKGFVLFLRLFPFPVSRTICFDIPGLREGTDRCGRKLRQAKFRFLQFLPLAPLRQTYGILFGDAGQALTHPVIFTVSLLRKSL